MADNILSRLSLHDYLDGSFCSIDVIDDFLRIGVSINSQDPCDATPLHHAVANEHCSMEVIKYLLEMGADIQARDEHGLTALHYLVEQFRWNAIDVASLLLDNGAEVDEVDYEGATALHHAVQTRHNKDIVEFLLDRGANINALCYFTGSTLHYAMTVFNESEAFNINAEEGDYDIIKLLLDRGADVNYRCRSKCALHFAARHCKSRIIKLLINYGAEINIVEIHNLSPLRISVGLNNREVSKTLLDCGALLYCGENPLEQVVRKYLSRWDKVTLEHLQLLLKYGMFEVTVLKTPEEMTGELWETPEKYIISCLPEEVKDYNIQCVQEILAMQSISVGNTTLQKFIFQLRQEMKHKKKDEVIRILTKLLYFISTNAFPIYNEVIAGVMNRDNLEAYLENQVVYTVPKQIEDGVSGCQNRVILSRDKLRIVTGYLSDLDLLNLSLAFYNSHDY